MAAMVELLALNLEDRRDFERWQDYIHSRSDSHCADLAQWRLLFRELYGFQHHDYVCLQGDRIAGALSLYEIRSPLMGPMLVTCPFFGYGGFYWDSEAAREALLERARCLALESRVDTLELRSSRELPPPLRVNADFAEFNLTLGATPEETWNRRLSSNARQNIRRARAHDLEFRLSADHERCFNLLRRTLRAHGTPFHGRRFFQLLDQHLGEQVRYSEVWHAGRVVAAAVVIRFRQTILTPYIGSLARYRSLRPNYLQYWGLIEHYAAAGVRRFEMGRSPRGSSHAQFKIKWGCDEMPLFYNYWVVNPRGRYRTVSRPSALQRLATRVWKRLPLRMTTTLGPRLFRYLP